MDDKGHQHSPAMQDQRDCDDSLVMERWCDDCYDTDGDVKVMVEWRRDDACYYDGDDVIVLTVVVAHHQASFNPLGLWQCMGITCSSVAACSCWQHGMLNGAELARRNEPTKNVYQIIKLNQLLLQIMWCVIHTVLTVLVKDEALPGKSFNFLLG